MTDAIRLKCPTCETSYKIVRVEAAPNHDRPMLCLSCGGPLRGRDGEFALKYFRIGDDGGHSARRRLPRMV